MVKKNEQNCLISVVRSEEGRDPIYIYIDTGGGESLSYEGKKRDGFTESTDGCVLGILPYSHGSPVS